MQKERIVILGAAGRDFHNFNVLYRHNPKYEVVAFTATQIPHIEGRTYPAVLAGEGYPGGIPIVPETELPALFQREKIDTGVFSYSDVPYEYVMQRAALVNALGADFVLLGADRTMLPSVKPVHRQRKEPDHAPHGGPAARARIPRGGGAASHALR